MTQYPYQQPMSGPPRQRRAGLVVAALALCVALLALGMFAGSWWARNRPAPQPSATTLPGPTSEPSASPSASTTSVDPSQNPDWPVDSTEPTHPVPHPENINQWALEATTLVTATRPDGSVSAGTGIIVDMDGWVVTNYHVIQDSTEIILTIWDGTEYPAKVAGRDIWRDIAVLVTSCCVS